MTGERQLLEAAGDGYGLADLDATPGAAWGVLILGERFYGATLAEAAAKAVEFARDVDQEVVEEIELLGLRAWRIGPDARLDLGRVKAA